MTPPAPAPPPHAPAWHILDNTFTEKDQGLTPPDRQLVPTRLDDVPVCRTDWSSQDYNSLTLAQFKLRITNLDRADPPGYGIGRYPRDAAFNANSGTRFIISSVPAMPEIPVVCDVVGWDPANSPLYWRIQFIHILCRHQSRGSYQYRGVCEVLQAEWQGTSTNRSFSLFQPSTNPAVTYTYNTNSPDTVVMGGHAILCVAAKPPGCDTVLMDYVHLRVGATNPTRADVNGLVDRHLLPRDANVAHMVKAVFDHENRYAQFSTRAQTSTHMIFKQKHHFNHANQPDCNVLFDWPDDPENFPSVSFDWGVGISQYTKTPGIIVGAAACWDWRENVKRGMNEFVNEKLRHISATGLTWRQWAKKGWHNYNGSGPQADAYANTLEALAEGQAVSTAAIPAGTDTKALTERIPDPVSPGQPPSWPPFFPPGDYPIPTAKEGAAKSA